MNFDILIIFYFIAGISVLLLAGIIGANINQLMGIRIQRPHLAIKERSELPDYLNGVFDNGVRLLESLGFEYHHCQYTLDILCHQRNDKWTLVFLNKQTNVFAEISPASTFLDLPGYEIDFWSIAKDGTALITMNGRGHTILCGITNAEIHDPMAITLSEVYESHLTERQDVFGKKQLLALSADNYRKVQQKLFDGYFLNLMNERAVISTGSNQFRLSFAKARRLLPQVLKGQKRLRKLLHDKLIMEETQRNKLEPDEQINLSGSNFSVEAEVQSYLKMRSVQERTPGGITARLVLFVLVLALTYFAFDLQFTFYSIVIVAAVIAFHEAGHIATMLLFGYRNFQILFFPVFIDTTLKTKATPAVWQQVIVYLMGPVPGIIAGLVFLGLSQEYEIAWLYETSVVLLVFNYLNLLPIAPLDGGHLIRFTIMERFPSGKLILAGMGGLAFAAGGWYIGEPVFWVIAIVLFSTLPWSALEAGVLSELFDPTSDFETLETKHRLRRLFETFRQQRFSKLQYLQKFNLVKGLSDTLLVPGQLGRLGALGLNTIYLSALLFTPAVAIITVIGMDNTAEMVAKIQGETPSKNWDTLIEKADEPGEKFETTLKAAQFYVSIDNFPRAQNYLEQAEKTLALIYSEKNLASLFGAYASYYLQKKELDNAEEYQNKVVKLLEQAPRENAFELTTSYQNLASIRQLQDGAGSTLYLKTALSYALNITAAEERYIITSVINQLLNRYYQTTDYASAKTILLDTLSILSRHQDAPSQYVASYLYQELGWINVATNSLNQSFTNFESALSLSDENDLKIVDVSNYGYDPFTKVNILLAMAVVQNQAGNLNSSNNYLKQAETLLQENYNESLSGYIESNVIDATSKFSKDTTDAGKAPEPELSRKSTRWQLIAGIMTSEAIKTERLELPAPAASSNRQATNQIEKNATTTEKQNITDKTTLTENGEEAVISTENRDNQNHENIDNARSVNANIETVKVVETELPKVEVEPSAVIEIPEKAQQSIEDTEPTADKTQ